MFWVVNTCSFVWGYNVNRSVDKINSPKIKSYQNPRTRWSLSVEREFCWNLWARVESLQLTSVELKGSNKILWNNKIEEVEQSAKGLKSNCTNTKIYVYIKIVQRWKSINLRIQTSHEESSSHCIGDGISCSYRINLIDEILSSKLQLLKFWQWVTWLMLTFQHQINILI